MPPLPLDPQPDDDDLADDSEFDPSLYKVVTNHTSYATLARTRESDEYIQDFTAKVYKLGADFDEEPSAETLVATADFQHVGFDAWGGDGWSKKSDFADAQSEDLLEIAEALFDDDGDTRVELEVTLPGCDLLYFRRVEVQAVPDGFEVIRHLLESVVRRYGHGCMGAAYYQADSESIGIARPLKDRGFNQLPSNRHIWFADLGKRRPPLGDEDDFDDEDDEDTRG